MARSLSVKPIQPARRPPSMLDRAVRGKKAWTRKSLRREDWLIPIPSNCLKEIHRMVRTLRVNPMETMLLSADDYGMDGCKKYMKRVRGVLDEGAGFALLHKLPVDEFSKDEMKAVYWTLSSLIARPVAQSYGGTMLYDVGDTGKKIATRVRGDVTSQELTFHTDYGFNVPPPYIGLLVLRTARKGGESAVVSLHTVHNELRWRYPDQLARLYRPFYWNRQGEHPPSDPIANVNPLFEFDGKKLKARIHRRLLLAGYELMGETMDKEGKAALDTLFELLDDPRFSVKFSLEPGQMQFLNNWQCAHRRSEYIDYKAPNKRRHLVRIFLRDEGARTYMG